MFGRPIAPIVVAVVVVVACEKANRQWGMLGELRSFWYKMYTHVEPTLKNPDVVTFWSTYARNASFFFHCAITLVVFSIHLIHVHLRVLVGGSIINNSF